MKTKIQIASASLFCALCIITCTPSDPPLKTVDSTNTFKLLTYTYDFKENGWNHEYGNEVNRINPIGLSIKRAYTTSDGVDHVVLRGRIKKGIPLGLAYNYIFNGRGDFFQNWGTPLTPAVVDDDTLLAEYEEDLERVFSTNPTVEDGVSPNSGGSAEAFSITPGAPPTSVDRWIFDGIELGMEWRYKGGFAAVTLSGMIDDSLVTGETAITEVNDSLRLYSAKYRKDHYPDYATFFTTGDWYRTKILKNNPNSFAIKDGVSQPRNGYSFLISEEADPKQATFEITYIDGTKHTVVVDYSEVEFLKKPLKKQPAGSTPPGTVDDGIRIYNCDNYDPATNEPQSNPYNLTATPTSEKITLTAASGDPEATGTVTLDATTGAARLWFNWIPYDSTCRIKSIAVDDDGAKIEWDDYYENIKISPKETGGTISGAYVTLKLTQPYNYDADDPDAYIDTIVLTLN
ncbi:MAG: hypothetical protein Ta2G_06340 [Termitinemataceae bacterium]|nr:MAG: hypothetical protein Ta2G_06340 [Termitinemataceae bacterium]